MGGTILASAFLISLIKPLAALQEGSADNHL